MTSGPMACSSLMRLISASACSGVRPMVSVRNVYLLWRPLLTSIIPSLMLVWRSWMMPSSNRTETLKPPAASSLTSVPFQVTPYADASSMILLTISSRAVVKIAVFAHTVEYVRLFSLTTSVAVLSPPFRSNDSAPGSNPTCVQRIERRAFIAATCSSTRSSTELSLMLSESVSSVARASYTSSLASKYRTCAPLGDVTVRMALAGTMIRFRPSRNSLWKLSKQTSSA